eukprot:CAMPEP_0183742164 /NCGR_PEP_ID=MMETSP0737-20130205/64092_1 /TAXON_ID=385413 /ORGANISM="Thalassiosira miniscula, Strain CCMP1093" /LENGTH=55 /DNA_ID=CAMNT_0025977705 /DNA_START=156 /DNA_END=319 /DNA_ORIENTATION=+
MELQQPKLCNELASLQIELELVEKMANEIFPTLRKSDDDIWGVEDTFSEHQTNIA